MLTIKQLYKKSAQYKRARNIAKQRNKLELEQHIKNSEEWYKLDNAGLIFPAIQQSSWNSMFRLSAYLYEQVDARILEQAINDIMPRFPAFNVSLKRGFFWYYFQQLDKPIKVEQEHSNVCSAIALNKTTPLFRVLYFNKKISVEFFHSLTDGRSGLAFLNTLVSRYLVLKGYDIDVQKLPISYLDNPDQEEWEDAFNRYCDLKEKAPRKEKTAYQLSGEINKKKKVNIISLILESDKVKEIARNKYNCSVHEMLSAVLIKALCDEQLFFNKKKIKPVRISVAADMRQFFPSKTLRNFVNVINIGINPDKSETSLEQCINAVKQQMKLFTKEQFMKINNTNVADQRNFLIRIIPLFIKNFVMNMVYFQSSEKGFACPFSNIGVVNDNNQFKGLVDKYDFIVGPLKFNKFASTVITYNNKLTFSFSLKVKETSIVKSIAKIFNEMGLKIFVESNIN